jgi:DNA-binding NtrC family response regulator
MVTQRKKPNKSRYVLIIEDNVHHAELLTELLDRHFAPVIIHTVDTIADGLEFARKSNYDLVLTDGIINETPITDSMRKLVESAGSAPVVVISGRGDERLATELIQQGAAEYFVKTRESLESLPSSITKLLSKVKRTRNKRVTPEQAEAKSRSTMPTPEEIVHEMDRLTQEALAISGGARRNKRRHANNDEQFDRLLIQIKRLRSMAEKLIGNK